MRKARRQRAPTYCFPSSFQIIVTPVTSWLVPAMRIWGQLLPWTAEPGVTRPGSCSSFLPLQQSSSANDHLLSHSINLYSLMKVWDSGWYFKCCFSPFSWDLLLYPHSLFHLQLLLYSSACFLGNFAELGLVEQDCDFVRESSAEVGNLQPGSVLFPPKQKFSYPGWRNLPNFLDNNSQATCVEQLWWLQGIFAFTYLRPLQVLAVVPLKLGLYLPKGDRFCFCWWLLAKLSLRWALIFSASVVFRWNVNFPLLQAKCTPQPLCLNQQVVVFFLGETKIDPGWSHPSIKPILSPSPWFLWFITSSSLFLPCMEREGIFSQWVTPCPTGIGTSVILHCSLLQDLGFTWLRYILLNLQVNLLQFF